MQKATERAMGRALVIEANGLVALDTREMLLELGFAEVAALARVDTALDAIAQCAPDWSLIDARLAADDLAPVMAALDAVGATVVLVSSRPDGSDIDPRWTDRAFLTRPYGPADLAAVLNSAG